MVRHEQNGSAIILQQRLIWQSVSSVSNHRAVQMRRPVIAYKVVGGKELC